VNALAKDSDGTITRVEFFDNGESIGIATPAGADVYVITRQNASFGPHSFYAVATDNGGRQNISNVTNIMVNGAATVGVMSPSAGALLTPASSVTVSANASHPSGVINKVEFFANGQSIGIGSSVGGSQYSVAWNNLNDGIYALVAVATDGSGVTTTSAPVTVTVDSSPTIAMTNPADGSVFPSLTNISLSAIAENAYAPIARVDFYANGVLVGSASDVGTDKFTATWRHLADGFYSLAAVATDTLGVSTTSARITIGVNTTSPQPGEFVWFDDDVPAGATKHADGDVDWYWVDANPASFSGSKAHQSRTLGQLEPPTSIHQHYFEGATATLPINTGDRLFTYVFLDINNMPRQITLQWKDANGWEHRAYWQGNSQFILYNGTNQKPGNYFMGPLPTPGKWVRLEVSAAAVGLEGSTINGMAFILDGGRATWDLAGKVTANALPRPTTPPGDSVWVDDAVPAGSTSETFNDQWQWLPPHACGTQGHRSYFTVNQGAGQFRSHSFRGATATMSVNPGDVLFTYVYLDANNMPDELMLQWHDGSGWEHRAFWGENYIGQLVPNMGVQGTESQRFMGGLPPGNQWVRLEVPASYVGLEGKTVSGMSFGFYSTKDHAGINWDCSGKSAHLTTTPLALSATTGVWRLFSNKYGYSYNTNDQAEPDHFPQKKDVFFVHPNQAAGTVPMHRFRRPGNYEYFYTTCRTCSGSDWQYDGVAFYVYPNATTPGTVPLYLYHDSHSKYFLTVNQNEASGMVLDGTWGYVYGVNPQIPFGPTQAVMAGCILNWRDNSATETGFRIEQLNTNDGSWNQIGTASANNNAFCVAGDICNQPGLCMSTGSYRVRAFNDFGDSAYSNVADGRGELSAAQPADPEPTPTPEGPPPNTDPNLNITSPPDGDVVDRNFAIHTNAFDMEGNGTLTLVEVFANGNKVGEVTDAPFVFVWNNAPFGTYSLTAVVTDNTGATTTSTPVNITVGMSNQTITFDPIPDKSYGDAPFTVNATASSGLPVSYSIVSGPATISGNTVTIIGTGSVTVRASQAGDANNNAAPDADLSFNVVKASQTITFNPLPNKTYGDASFTVSASCSAGLPVSFSIASGPATIVGSTVTLTGAGTVTVRASQSGNENYNAATDVDQSFTVAKASATITLTNQNQNYDGTPKSVTATTNPSGLSGVSIKYNGSSTAPSNAGSYSVVASLTNDNYSASDATGTLIINAPPTVSITSPINGALLHATSVTISASAADSDGSVSKVEFFQGSVKLGQVDSAPFNFLWNNVAGGSYSLTAVATDNSGSSTVSSPVSITVNNPPNISVTASSPQDIPTAPAQISISADASDPDGTISKVEFYQGTTLLATDLTNPYSYTWSNVAAGNYSITAKATDNVGAVTTSNVVGFTVNAKPNVSLTSPGNGVSFIAPALVSLNATASDSDGSISKVEFYQGSTLISTVTSSPYSFNWSYVPAGTYALTAKATDNVGAVTTSNSVTIAVSPNSVAIGKIAFASNRDGCAQIYLMNTDGTGQSCLSNNTANDDSPKWSPDNSRIVFQSDRDFQSNTDNPIYGSDIYVMNWDGSAPTRLTYASYDDSAPVWSPDGTKIAFQSFRNGVNSQIYVMNADGSGQVNISNSTANDIEPSWSPDGTKIAFASDRDQTGLSSIYVMSANGTGQTRITSSGSGFLDEQPAWSPDGMKLAFTTTRDSTVVTWDEWDSLGNLVVKTKLLINKEVYVMNADGSSPVRLTNIMGNDDQPMWSPDGTKILFRSDRDRNCCDPVSQIWTMNADGSNQINLSNSNFGDYCPSWSR
jgi:Tol biopolymer transport system component